MKIFNFLAFIVILLLFFQNGNGQTDLSFTANEVSFKMIFVEGGTFMMGCASEYEGCYPEEKPQHKVNLTDFYMGEFQVTQKLWQAIMGTNVRQQWLMREIADRELYSHVGGGSIFDVSSKFSAEDFAKVIPLNGEGYNYPMYFINYSDCELFCYRLNHLLSKQLPEGYRFCIPSEAQWEYAARGGKLSKGYIYSGSNTIEEVAWFENNSEKSTSQVGKKLKNELGIYDMSGNVWEWCKDWYDEQFYNYSLLSNPTGPIYGDYRVLRGGSWWSEAIVCRTSFRYKTLPHERTVKYGFRLALVNVKNTK